MRPLHVVGFIAVDHESMHATPGLRSKPDRADLRCTSTSFADFARTTCSSSTGHINCSVSGVAARDHLQREGSSMSEAPKKRGGIRKRTVQREDDEDEPETLSLREQIQERQHQQQQRRREQALRAEVLANGLKKLNAAQADGLSQRETNDLLDSYVREQVEEKGAGESHMEAFIKEQMQKRLGKDAEEAAASGSQLHPDDELYAVPSDLQGQSTKAQDPGAWATGIVEVALPVEYKMRNIEETEAAKRRLLHASRETQDEMQSHTSGPALRRGIYPSGFGKLTALTAPPQTSDSYVADKMRDEWKAKKKKKRHV